MDGFDRIHLVYFLAVSYALFWCIVLATIWIYDAMVPPCGVNPAPKSQATEPRILLAEYIGPLY